VFVKPVSFVADLQPDRPLRRFIGAEAIVDFSL